MVALLPGSRDEAVSNIRMMLTIVSKLSLKSSFQFVFSLSNHIQLPELQAAVRIFHGRFMSKQRGLNVHCLSLPLR